MVKHCLGSLHACVHTFLNIRVFSKTKNNFNKAQQYVEGIVLSELNNIERISETLDSDYHKLKHLIQFKQWKS